MGEGEIRIGEISFCGKNLVMKGMWLIYYMFDFGRFSMSCELENIKWLRFLK